MPSSIHRPGLAGTGIRFPKILQRKLLFWMCYNLSDGGSKPKPFITQLCIFVHEKSVSREIRTAAKNPFLPSTLNED
jgi:hypothetical protein